MPPVNIFVLGLEEQNLGTLRDVPGAEDYAFHTLLSHDELLIGDVPIAELLERAQHRLDSFDGSVDAIIGYWDFPVVTMVPILCRRLGLRSASLEAVVKCEHKYWSRLEQRKVIDELPRFALLDPYEDDGPPEDVRYPMWIKPVKGYSSELAFRVTDDEEYRAAMAETREGIGRLGKPFEWVLEQLDLPPEIEKVGGEACLAEEQLSGVQAAIEGYSQDGRIEIYGILDSHNYPGSSSFLRHQYPSTLPAGVREQLVDVSERVIRQIGLDNTTFSIEYFVDLKKGTVGLLEINPRHSQSHAELFEQVDGIPNHHCMIALALGRDPSLPHRKGPYAMAAKWYLRRFEDGVVRHRASAEEIERLHQEIPGVEVVPLMEPGTRLSGAEASQDSYSYELAHIYVGADSEEELREKYDACVEALDYRFDDVPGADGPDGTRAPEGED